MLPWSLARGLAVHVVVGGCLGGTRVGYTGWVTGRVIPGHTQCPAAKVQLLEEVPRTSEAGPVGPSRAGVGGFWVPDVLDRSGDAHPPTHPAGPVGPAPAGPPW